MNETLPQFKICADPVADPKAVVVGTGVRFSVLTPRVLRLEFSLTSRFEDLPSQAFWYRRQPIPEFEMNKTANDIDIITKFLHLRYHINESGFTNKSLSIELKGSGVVWHYGDPNYDNLRGTTRTLDEVNGSTRLEEGLISRSGWSLVNDGQSLVFNDDGWLKPRDNPGNLDLYFFGAGNDYRQCLKDFRKISGPTPLIPRWILGNWWSRYWAYSQADLTNLIEAFKTHDIPLSICIIDMDWHIVRQEGNYFWTGYSWNKDLFPDPEGFLAWLHQKGLKTALNLHPADGVKPHESQYLEFARFLGLDPSKGEPIEFDCADPCFVQAYFELLHHPNEECGVDFWWLDWQQGRSSRVPGLDPLWWLNHLHFLDLKRDRKRRSLIFSRWGGLGNHRYPIGFSGDTIVSWESLAFQPYFTSTAANVGYGWWSHDIGGHMNGLENSELYARWIQCGVFSPILRLHSSNNPYQDRRPWIQDAESLEAIRSAMQLRHRLIPYLYSMAWRDHIEGIPLVSPMYHEKPENEEAYNCPNQYLFGSELIAAPYTCSRDPDTRLSRQVIWLPKGDWFDFFTGEYIPGDQWIAYHGTLSETPVFAKAGAIVPLGPNVSWGGVDNPKLLQIQIFPGADNRFELFEDDGDSNNYEQGGFSLTPFTQTWEENRLLFKIGAAQGDPSHLPAIRSYELFFFGISLPQQISLTKNAKAFKKVAHYDAFTETLVFGPVSLKPTESLTLSLENADGSLVSKRDRGIDTARRFLRIFRLPNKIKLDLDESLPEILRYPGSLNSFGTDLKESHVGVLSSLAHRITR